MKTALFVGISTDHQPSVIGGDSMDYEHLFVKLIKEYMEIFRERKRIMQQDHLLVFNPKTNTDSEWHQAMTIAGYNIDFTSCGWRRGYFFQNSDCNEVLDTIPSTAAKHAIIKRHDRAIAQMQSQMRSAREHGRTTWSQEALDKAIANRNAVTAAPVSPLGKTYIKHNRLKRRVRVLSNRLAQLRHTLLVLSKQNLGLKVIFGNNRGFDILAIYTVVRGERAMPVKEFFETLQLETALLG